MNFNRKEYVERKSIRFYIIYNCPHCGLKITHCLGDSSNPQFYDDKHEDECWKCHKKTGIHIQVV